MQGYFSNLKQQKLGVFVWLWLLAPIAVWFSYQPLFRLGRDATMHFELSVTLVYLLVLALAGVPILWSHRAKLIKSRVVIYVLMWLVLTAVTLIWTPNLVRGLLTVGIVGMLSIVFAATWAESRRVSTVLPVLISIMLVSAVVVSILAVIQMFAGVWLDQSVTLLCNGCVAEQFGFVRSNVFAIEPQFLGSMLLIPALLSAGLATHKRYGVLAGWVLFIVTIAIFLTMSRGAIFAFGVGMIVLLVASRVEWRRLLQLVGTLVAGVIIALSIQGFTAAINPTVNETFMGAVTKVVNNLTLGLVDLDLSEKPSAVNDSAPGSTSSPTTAPLEAGRSPNFDGYVEESTDERVNRTQQAIHVWSQAPSTIITGVGIGGSGVSLSRAFPEDTIAREIVQNEFVERLLETGVIGLLLFVGALVCVLYVAARHKVWWLVGLLGAFIVQWNFFSGYPNLLHVYLVVILAIVLFSGRHGGLQSAKRY